MQLKIMKIQKNQKNKKACPEQSRRVVVALSGGVDSSVCAALLKKAGFQVIGVMAKFWKDGESKENKCCSLESEKLARQVAKKLEIPFYVVNLEKEFKKKVVDYFLKEYKSGNTPNPCVICNKEIKFGLLQEKAFKMGADFFATGHYAKIENKNLLPRLFKGTDEKKDQSYFLWQLNQQKLNKILFPVGNYTKQEVRNLAKKFDLPSAKTPESQEVCFVKDNTNNFLKKYLKIKPGKIFDINKKEVGKHQGLWFYTIGQRKGLEIVQGPWFVIEKDFKKNILIVSKNEKDLLKKELIAEKINWILPQNLPIDAEVKIRYKSDFAKVKIIKYKKNLLKIIFKTPQKAITPGQSIVFYKKKELLGGGIIL
jgi:tRNA-specific 2-thiouridylase